MTVREITGVLEELAPPVYQESYDNSGLLVGEPTNEVNKVLVCLDCLETVVDEAIEKGAEMIVAHHPIVFGGLKRLTGKTYSERVVMKALRNNIAIYAIHTNLDNVQAGVNKKIGERWGWKTSTYYRPCRKACTNSLPIHQAIKRIW
jgi:dinuclear metal center YbgI/SA1388 family protein